MKRYFFKLSSLKSILDTTPSHCYVISHAKKKKKKKGYIRIDDQLKTENHDLNDKTIAKILVISEKYLTIENLK